ncbi:MAG: WD40-like beta Propeller containing protein [Geminicoccaceae bacterium]|nr:WD40-like beta Propeller containing protein [Geminicoccaceae bacterium]
MTRFPRAVLVAALAALVPLAPLSAQDTLQQAVRIGLRYDPGTKPGVLVLRVPGANGDSIRAILQRDFDYGDRINVVAADEAGFPDTPVAGRNGNYALYGRLGAIALVQATPTASGLHVAVHDVADQKVERVRDFALEGAVNSREWRMSLHAVADEIELWITGVRGIAATRVAYVQGVRNGRLYVVDSDGAFPTPVGNDAGVMSPNWHPKGTHIVYSVIGSRGCCQIFVYDVASGTARQVPVGSGLNSTPVFAPDGVVIVYTHGEESGTDLFATTPFDRGPTRRITVGRGTDNTTPAFSPDGRKLAFTTGRLGRPEIYISDADGTNPELLTSYNFGDQNYRANPDWSPDGRLIAFQALQPNGQFQLNTISLRDRSVKQLTSQGSNEDASWAPDSRHIIFSSTRTGQKQLFVIDTESGRWRQLTRNGGVRLPAWSPPLKR